MAEAIYDQEEPLVSADCTVEYLQSVAQSIYHRSRDGQVIQLTEVMLAGLAELEEQIGALDESLAHGSNG